MPNLTFMAISVSVEGTESYYPLGQYLKRERPRGNLPTCLKNESNPQGLRNTLLTSFFSASHMSFSMSCFSLEQPLSVFPSNE